MRTLVIANPRSGGRERGAGSRYFSEIRAVIERRMGGVDLALTERPAHAIELAREAALGGCALVVAVGGDGTLHEVANGVLQSGSSCSVGFIGQGTGGDFRRTLGIDHRLDAYVEAIAAGRERRIDAGRIRYRGHDGADAERWFVNILSVGMGGLVDRYVSRTSKALGGKAAYYAASARALLESRRARVRCEASLGGASEVRRIEAFVIAVCNGRYFGGGMHVAPMARADDRRFEVISIDAPTKLAFPAAMQRLYSGRHVGTPGVGHFACDRIAMDLETEDARPVFLLDVDGEPLGGLPVEITLVPGALTVRAPWPALPSS